MTVPKAKFNKLLNDVALIREVVIANRTDDEGELTDWAKDEFANARKVPDSDLISMDEIKKEFL